MSNKQIVRGLVESIGDEFIHYKLSLGNCTMTIGEEQIDDVIDVLIELREGRLRSLIDGD